MVYAILRFSQWHNERFFYVKRKKGEGGPHLTLKLSTAVYA